MNGLDQMTNRLKELRQERQDLMNATQHMDAVKVDYAKIKLRELSNEIKKIEQMLD